MTRFIIWPSNQMNYDLKDTFMYSTVYANNQHDVTIF